MLGLLLFFTYYLSIRNGAKLKCTATGWKISCVLNGVARFPQMEGLDNILAGQGRGREQEFGGAEYGDSEQSSE